MKWGFFTPAHLATLMLAVIIPTYTLIATMVLTTCGSGGKLNVFGII